MHNKVYSAQHPSGYAPNTKRCIPLTKMLRSKAYFHSLLFSIFGFLAIGTYFIYNSSNCKAPILLFVLASLFLAAYSLIRLTYFIPLNRKQIVIPIIFSVIVIIWNLSSFNPGIDKQIWLTYCCFSIVIDLYIYLNKKRYTTQK